MREPVLKIGATTLDENAITQIHRPTTVFVDCCSLKWSGRLSWLLASVSDEERLLPVAVPLPLLLQSQAELAVPVESTRGRAAAACLLQHRYSPQSQRVVPCSAAVQSQHRRRSLNSCAHSPCRGDLQRAKDLYTRAAQLDQHSAGAEAETAEGQENAIAQVSMDDRAALLSALRFLRDLSLLSSLELAAGYAHNTRTLLREAYRVEEALYGERSLAAAARLLSLAPLEAPDDALQTTSAALMLHQNALGDTGADESHAAATNNLRLASAWDAHSRARNSNGSGRLGLRAAERSLQLTVSSVGGDAHPASLSALSLLCDTQLALGGLNDALASARRGLTASQSLWADEHPVARSWKERVLHAYQVIQRANEEQRRREAERQAEQVRKLQQQQQQQRAAQEAKHREQQRQQQQPQSASAKDEM